MKLVVVIIALSTFSICKSAKNDDAENYRSNNAKLTREKRLLPIFSVVTFPNTQCTLVSAASTNLVMLGICRTSSECISNGGSAGGTCAAGFGVCCMQVLSTCGGTVDISKNISYIQNPGFSAGYSTAGTCTYTFTANSEICQIRLDFNNFVIVGPDTTGSCTVTDRMVSTSPSGYSPPVLCGTLTETHMYIETGRMMTPAATMGITIGNPVVVGNPVGVGIFPRTWKIRTTFIECSSALRAPTDCLQYFTGVSGNFRSYNYMTTGNQILTSQNYNYCFRQEAGYCSVDLSLASIAFSVNSGAPPTKSLRTCTGPYLMISTVITISANSEVFCGIYFNNIDMSVANGVVTVNTLPFMAAFFSVNTIVMGMITMITAPIGNGFNINFNQKPC